MWTRLPSHRAWLDDQFTRLVAFAVPSIRRGGGFEWLDVTGIPMPGRSPQLFLTARMTYVASLATVRGIPGSGALLDHGIASLLDYHADAEHGGWISSPETDRGGRKMTYDHVHVGFAAANAVFAGHPQARELLGRVVDVVESRLWREEERALVESYAGDWTDLEEYRGANSNMHGIEAFLAMGAALDDPTWFERARDMADRIVNRATRQNGWLMPEHFTGDWEPDLGYNRAEPRHQFRPYGWTIGHAFEWSRLLLEIEAALGAAARGAAVPGAAVPGAAVPGWLVEAARAMADAAFDAWAIDGTDGFVYTTGWEREVVEPSRLHWPLCEAIQAAAVLAARTGDPAYEQWYQRCWDHAARYFIDPATATWANELNADLVLAEDIWPGRADFYHTVGALLTPQAPIGPNLTAGLRHATEPTQP